MLVKLQSQYENAVGRGLFGYSSYTSGIGDGKLSRKSAVGCGIGVVDDCVFRGDDGVSVGRHCSQGTDGGRAKLCWGWSCSGINRRLCLG